MAGVKGSSPKDLASTNPVADLAQSVTPQLATPSPQVAQPPPTPEAAPNDQTPLPQVSDPNSDPDVQAIMAQHSNSDPSQDPDVQAIMNESNDQVESEAQSGEPADFMTRAKTDLGSTTEAKEDYLKNIYGDKNVRRVKDRFFFKDTSDKSPKWRPFNADWMGMGDPANLTRMATVEAGALPAEIVGGAAATGEAATGVGLPAAGLTLAGSRMAGGVMGESLAQTAAGMAGFPNRGMAQNTVDQLNQGGMRAAMGAGFDAVGNALSNKFTPLAGVAQKAEQYAQDIAQEMAPKTPLQATLHAVRAADEVSKAIQANPDIPVFMHQMNTANPAAKADAATASRFETARDAFNKSGTALVNAVEKFATKFGAGDKNIGESFADSAALSKQAMGAALGNDRKEFLDMAGEQVFQAPTLKGTLAGIQKNTIEDVDYTTGIVHTKSPAELGRQFGARGDAAESLGKDILDIYTKVQNATLKTGGQFSADELEKNSQMLARETDIAFKQAKNGAVPYDYAFFLKKMRDSVNDDYVEAMTNTLSKANPQFASKYQANREGYHLMKNAEKTIGTLLTGDTSSRAFANRLFSDTSGGLARIDTAKAVANVSDPDGWNSVLRGHLDNLMSIYRNSKDSATPYGNVKWGKIADDWAQKKAIYTKAYGEENYQALNNLWVIGKQLEEGNIKAVANSPGRLRELGGALAKLGDLHVRTAVIESLKALGGETWALRKVLADNGPKLLKVSKPSQRPQIEAMMQKIMGNAASGVTAQQGANVIRGQ